MLVSELVALRVTLAGKGATGRPVEVLDEVVRRLELLERVADAAESLRDSHRVGSISLVARDERRLDAALDALRSEA